MLELADDVADSLRRHAMLARGVSLKLRYDDFVTLTRSQVLAEPVDATLPLFQHGSALLRALHSIRPIRLIGITAYPLVSATERQLSLFTDTNTEKARKVDAALDTVRQRFGSNAIMRARLLESPEED